MRQAGLHVSAPEYCFIFPRRLSALRFVEKRVSRIPLGAQYLVLGSKPGRA